MVFGYTVPSNVMDSARQFRSTELVKILPGVSMRNLQYWDERKLAPANREKNTRSYTYAQALTVALVLEIRKRGLSTYKTRRAVKLMGSLLESEDVDMVIIDAKQQPVIAIDEGVLLDKALGRPQPFIVVSLDSLREKLNRKVKP